MPVFAVVNGKYLSDPTATGYVHRRADEGKKKKNVRRLRKPVPVPHRRLPLVHHVTRILMCSTCTRTYTYRRHRRNIDVPGPPPSNLGLHRLLFYPFQFGTSEIPDIWPLGRESYLDANKRSA